MTDSPRISRENGSAQTRSWMLQDHDFQDHDSVAQMSPWSISTKRSIWSWVRFLIGVYPSCYLLVGTSHRTAPISQWWIRRVLIENTTMPKLIYEFNELLDSSYKTFSSCCCTLLSVLKGRIFSIPFPRNYSRCVVINVVRPYCRTAVLIGRHSCNGTIVPVTCFTS